MQGDCGFMKMFQKQPEKADHVATLKYLKKSIFPDMY